MQRLKRIRERLRRFFNAGEWNAVQAGLLTRLAVSATETERNIGRLQAEVANLKRCDSWLTEKLVERVDAAEKADERIVELQADARHDRGQVALARIQVNTLALRVEALRDVNEAEAGS